MVWMLVSLQNSCAEILIPKVMMLGRGIFERWLGHENPYKEASQSSSASSKSEDPVKR